ncbi:MAG: NAD(P)-dependent oxidoreductase [Rhodospirillaceae bacterium]|nr:NAD(P)-dependent oxidoreductase [Rhodospirillaceae bacterium]MBT7954426.1 NAD(P)-dependent oxidoreductase [Rhodospirillaceae bacterium]
MSQKIKIVKTQELPVLDVGIIGLGAMGEVIADHLLANNFTVCGYDIAAERCALMAERGVDAKSSPQDVAEHADILISSLPSYQALQNVIGAEDGILQADKPGQILLETSTLKVSEKDAAAAQLEAAGKFFLDAPISGTTPLVRAMKGSLFIGGDQAAYEKCVPVIESFTATNFYVGGVGAGSKMKYLANYLVFVQTVAAAECFTLGQKAGFDPELIHQVIKESAGTSRMFEQRGEMMAKSDYRDGTAAVFNIFQKDAAIITDYAAENKSPIDLFVIAQQKFNAAAALGLDHLELAAVCKAIEMAAGIDRDMVED